MARETVFSDALLRRVEHAQRFNRMPVVNLFWRAGRAAVVGYSEPGFQHALFTSASEVVGQGQFQQLRGNPEAGRIPRLWSRLAVLTMPVETLAMAEASLKSAGVKAYHAMAYRLRAGKPIHAGVLSDLPYNGFGVTLTEQGQIVRAAAIRQGELATEAAAALFVAETGTLVIPGAMQVMDQLVPKTDFTERFPRLPIV